MGKNLWVYYYPTDRYEDANAKQGRQEFSANNSSNWDLSLYDYFYGSKQKLLGIVKEFWDAYNIESDSYEDDYIFSIEAAANLTMIASECPTGWFIEIENS